MNKSPVTSRLITFVVAGALLVVAAACGSSPSGSSKTPTTVKGGVYVTGNQWGDAQWVATLDPADVTDSTSIGNIWLIDANLVKLSFPSQKVIPDLADSWTVSKNRLVYTFHIRSNAKFANGDPVTAQDAAYSLTRSLLPSTKSGVAAIYLGAIKGATDVSGGKATTLSGVKALNSHSLQITLTQPISYFLGTLAYPTGDVLDPKVVRGHQANTYLTNTCSANLGAGPFVPICVNNSSKVTSFYPSGHSPYIEYKPNPYYYGPHPTIKIKAPFIADAQTSFLDYKAGQIESTTVPSADLAQAQKLAGYSKALALETDYITPNDLTGPMSNINCRLAVAYAIDRANITNKLLRGIEYPLYDVIPKGIPASGGGGAYFGKISGVPYYNPTKAKSYLSNCPGKLNNVSIPYQNTSPDLTNEYDAIKSDLQAIGANVTLKPLTFNAWLKIVAGTLLKDNHQDITENLWIDDYPDAQDWLQNLLGKGGFDNIGGYSNAQFNTLVNEGNIAATPALRGKYYKEASLLAVKDGAWIGVGGVYSIFVINPKVHGLIIGNGLVEPQNNNWANVSIS